MSAILISHTWHGLCRRVQAGPDLGGGGGGGGGGGATGAAAQGPLLLRGPPHGAHNNDIHVFLVYSNSF